MYCQSCGSRLAPNAKFCPECGARVGAASEVRPAATPAPAASPAAQTDAIEKPKRRFPLWAKIVGGVAVLIIAVIAISMWATGGLADTVNRQVDALKAGNIPAAYSETSQAFRDATSLPEFTAFVNSNPVLRQIDHIDIGARSFENNLGQVEGTITSTSGTTVPIVFRLVKENDQWRILGINLNPKSPPSK